MTQQLFVKPFPWKCIRCRIKTVVPAIVNYTTEIEHDGRLYTVNIPDLVLPRCEKCGEMIRTDAADIRITETFRDQLGLLKPVQIRSNREALGLTQKQLAGLLSIAEATLSRWETGGQIQQRSLDKLLRLFFLLPEVRSALSAGFGDPRPGSVVIDEVRKHSVISEPAASLVPK